MKTDIELEDGQKIWLATFTGQVVDSKKQSETSVYSQTDTVLSKVGSIPFTSVYSEVDREHSMWLRSSDGTEHEVLLPHHDFSTRQGHVVTVLWGAADGRTEGTYLGAVNHTTGSVWRKDLSSMLALAKTYFVAQQNLDRGRSPRGWTPGVLLSVVGIGIVTRYVFKAPWETMIITALLLAAPLWFFRRIASNVSHFSLMSNSLRLLDAQIERSIQAICSSKGAGTTSTGST